MADCAKPAFMDKSLTSMEWLHQINVGSGVESMRSLTLGPNECRGEKQSNGLSPPGSTPDSPRDGKPRHSYANLIMLAVKSSPRKMMTLSEIYDWITENFSYFKDAGNGWKNSIRHNLSLNKCFMKIPRPKDDPGKGSYWTVDDNFQDDAQFRKRRRSLPYVSDSSFTAGGGGGDNCGRPRFALDTTFSDLSASFCKLYQDVCERTRANDSANVINYDWMHNIDTLKESLRLAGSASSSFVLDDIDMTQFKSLLENMKQAEQQPESTVKAEQFRSLATTLSSLLDQAGILPAPPPLQHQFGQQQQQQQLVPRQLAQQQQQHQQVHLQQQPAHQHLPAIAHQQPQQLIHEQLYATDLLSGCTIQQQQQLHSYWEGHKQQAGSSSSSGGCGGCAALAATPALPGAYSSPMQSPPAHAPFAASPPLLQPSPQRSSSCSSLLTGTAQGSDLRWLARAHDLPGSNQHLLQPHSAAAAVPQWCQQQRQPGGGRQAAAPVAACLSSQLQDDDENPFDTDWDRML